MTMLSEPKPLILRDFPEFGIILRHAGDPRYSQEAEYFFQAPPELREVTNKYSIIIENTSDKAITALSIAYGFPRGGQSDFRPSTIRSDCTQARLTGPGDVAIIKPGGKRGYCFALQDGLGSKQEIQYIQLDRPTHPSMTEEILQQRNIYIRSQFDKLDRSWNESGRWEVEVEGAVFEDCVFVGTNRRNFFEQMNSKIEGARSLINELTEKLNLGEPYANLMAHAQNYAKVRYEDLLKSYNGSPIDAMNDEAFNFQMTRNTLAHWLILMGETYAINYLRKDSQKWAKLTKK